MCGIAGYIGKAYNDDDQIKLFNSLKEELARRGPDDFQSVQIESGCLFHSRLEILGGDLGTQPMIGANGNVFVYNGEIYNYRRLAQKYFPTKTECMVSDTAFLYNYLEKFGTGKLSELEGMFAFCFVNVAKNEAYLARDPIGEKPLYYRVDKGALVFGSTIKSVCLLHPEYTERPSMSLPGNYLSYPEPITTVYGVEKLIPGSTITYSASGIRKNQYWRLEKSVASRPNEVINKLEESISLCHTSDVDICCLYSGGIDSTLIPIVSKKLGCSKLNKLFHLYSNSIEYSAARASANRIGLQMEVVHPAGDDFTLDLKKAHMDRYDLPTIKNMERLYRAIRKDGYKVALTGNGADELFYGYDGAYKGWLIDKALTGLSLLPNDFRKSLVNKLLKRSDWLHTLFTSADVKLAKVARLSEEIEYDRHHEVIEKIEYFIDLIDTNSFLELSNYLGLISENAHSITLFADIPAMYNSVEARSPFLNHKLVELSFNLPTADKIDWRFRRGKKLLRQYYGEHLGREVLKMRKFGFSWGV